MTSEHCYAPAMPERCSQRKNIWPK